MDTLTVALRVLLASVCGAAIGLERSAKNRPAGFRTHTLVCMGASVAAMTGLYILLELGLPTDVSRISAQVVSGLGFIGAGTIIVTKKLTIKGLTTAAGLWTTGIIGLAIGSGYLSLGVIGTVLVLLVEAVFSVVGGRIRQHPTYKLEILYNDKEALDNVLRHCKDSHMTIIHLRIHALEEVAQYSAEVELRGHVPADIIVARIHTMPGIHSVMAL